PGSAPFVYAAVAGAGLVGGARAMRWHKRREAVLQQVMKMASLGESTAGMAHEINNALHLLHATTNYLQSGANKGTLTQDQMRDAVRQIGVVKDRIDRIIRSVRLFSRDGASDPLAPTPVSSLLAVADDLCRARFLRAGVQLEFAPVPP